MTLSVDPGDGRDPIKQNGQPGIIFQQSTPLQWNYPKAGIYDVTITAVSGENIVKDKQTVSVQGPIGEYSVKGSEQSAPLNQIYSIHLERISGNDPGFAQITIDWGDQSLVSTVRFDEQTSYTHKYTSETTTLIAIQLQNDQGMKIFKHPIVVEKSIENFGCQWADRPVPVNEPVIITVSMRSAQNVNLVYRCDPNDQTITNTLQSKPTES